MYKKIKRIFFLLYKYNIHLYKIIFFMLYLYEMGWLNSSIKKQSIDKVGNPIPWVTYSFLIFIKNRLKKDMLMYEFGSGNSTMFFSEKVLRVNSIEHNKSWYDYQINNSKYDNVVLEFSEGKNYYKNISRLGKKFNIIFIDGIYRNECIHESIKNLTLNGVIILDNSNRINEYKIGINFLLDNGFKKIDFYGISPICYSESATTIFYKENNCLDI